MVIKICWGIFLIQVFIVVIIDDKEDSENDNDDKEVQKDNDNIDNNNSDVDDGLLEFLY